VISSRALIIRIELGGNFTLEQPDRQCLLVYSQMLSLSFVQGNFYCGEGNGLGWGERCEVHLTPNKHVEKALISRQTQR